MKKVSMVAFLCSILFIQFLLAPKVSAQIIGNNEKTLSRIGMADYWKVGTLKGDGINVAVLDSGFGTLKEGEDEPTHENVKVKGGINCFILKNDECTKNYEDDDHHGTFVSGIIVGNHSSNNLGFKGIAPNVNLYAVKVVGSDGEGGNEFGENSVKKGVDWILSTHKDDDLSNDINVVNISLGLQKNKGYGELIDRMVEKGIVVVMSAGNALDGDDPMHESEIKSTLNDVFEETDNAIVVGSIDPYTNKRSPWSMIGPQLDLVAPGTTIRSSIPTNLDVEDGEKDGYFTDKGTSFSAPIVAGIAGLLMEKNPQKDGETPKEHVQRIKKYLIASAKPIKGYTPDGYTMNRNWEYGYGLVQPPGMIKLETPQLGYNSYLDSFGSSYLQPNLYNVLVDEDNDFLWKRITTSSGSKWIKTNSLMSDNFPNKKHGISLNGYDQYGKADVDINPDKLSTVTIEFWAKPERTNHSYRQDVISHDDGGFDRSVLIESYSDKWAVFTGDGVWSPVKANRNEWQHIAVTYTPDNIYFYKDGVKYDYNKETGEKPSNGEGLNFITLGKNYSYGEEFQGSIADLRIWNKKLNKYELNQVISDKTKEGLVAAWAIDENEGSIGKESIAGNDMNFYGNPKWNKFMDFDDSDYYIQYDGDEAEIKVKVGDIDYFGFGFQSNYNPLSGEESPNIHNFPFETNDMEASGTDKIMVPSSFRSDNASVFVDGYTTKTMHIDNSINPIEILYDLKGKQIKSAELQLYVDDFQPADSLVNSRFEFTINGVEIPSASDVINGLYQTGPKGKLIKVTVPENYLYLLKDGIVEIKIDDTTTGVGDGYAIDFAQLLINPKESKE